MSPADDRLTLLLRTLRDQAAPASPAWTDGNDADPGVTLLSLLAYLAEQLESRSAELPASARAEAARIGLQLSRLDPDDGPLSVHVDGEPPAAPRPHGQPQLERPSYFSGQLLTPGDLDLEQDYVREKFRRLQRAAFDVGVVAGLHVSVDATADAPAIVVSPGSALDAQGELIVLDGDVRCPLPPLTGDGLVLLRYVERVSALAMPTGQVQDDSASLSHPSRIAEGAAISVEETMDDGAVLLARLTQVDGVWTAAAPGAVPE